MESFYQDPRPEGMSEHFEMKWHGFPLWQLHDCYDMVFSCVYNLTNDGHKAYRWAWYAREYRIHDFVFDHARWRYFMDIVEYYSPRVEPEDIMLNKGFGEPESSYWHLEGKKRWKEILEEPSDDEDLAGKSFGESSSSDDKKELKNEIKEEKKSK